VAALLAADMEETAMHEEETTALLYAASQEGLGLSPRSHNEERLLRAQQLATGKNDVKYARSIIVL
jgi:hypothetical protein